ncbi:hypothetical protein JZ751_002835, partial [Albula glossodonta]
EDFESSLLSFEKLDRASPDLWPEQLPGVAEFAASFKSPITNSPPKWMAELENDDIEMLKELGSLTTANLMEKVKGLQNLAYQLGLEECKYMSYSSKWTLCSAPPCDECPRHGPLSAVIRTWHPAGAGRQEINSRLIKTIMQLNMIAFMAPCPSNVP